VHAGPAFSEAEAEPRRYEALLRMTGSITRHRSLETSFSKSQAGFVRSPISNSLPSILKMAHPGEVLGLSAVITGECYEFTAEPQGRGRSIFWRDKRYCG
jgi:hypothetical protein